MHVRNFVHSTLYLFITRCTLSSMSLGIDIIPEFDRVDAKRLVQELFELYESGVHCSHYCQEIPALSDTEDTENVNPVFDRVDAERLV